MVKKISYAELERAINEMGAKISAAELHGLLTGMLCAVRPPKESVWRELILESMNCAMPVKKHWDIISKTASRIASELTDISLGFIVLLPGDEIDLPIRAVELGAWCRGFLSGLGLAGISGNDLQNPVIKELVYDLSQIARLSADMQETTEEDERSYMELIEYLRIAVQNIQLELRNSGTNQMLH